MSQFDLLKLIELYHSDLFPCLKNLFNQSNCKFCGNDFNNYGPFCYCYLPNGGHLENPNKLYKMPNPPELIYKLSSFENSPKKLIFSRFISINPNLFIKEDLILSKFSNLYVCFIKLYQDDSEVCCLPFNFPPDYQRLLDFWIPN